MEELKERLVDHRKYLETMVVDRPDPNRIILMVKAQDYGSLETVLEQIHALESEFPNKKLVIVHSGVGPISESEINQADLIRAAIITMDIEASPDILLLAQKFKVQIQTFNIIYHLIDSVRMILGQKSTTKVKTSKIGEAVVVDLFTAKSASGKSHSGFLLDLFEQGQRKWPEWRFALGKSARMGLSKFTGQARWLLTT